MSSVGIIFTLDIRKIRVKNSILKFDNFSLLFIYFIYSTKVVHESGAQNVSSAVELVAIQSVI